MQTFTTTLKFFKEKDESTSPLQNVSSKIAADRQKLLTKVNGQDAQPACISKNLFEQAVSDKEFLNPEPALNFWATFYQFIAAKQILAFASLLQHFTFVLDLHVKDCLRSIHHFGFRSLHDQAGEDSRLLHSKRQHRRRRPQSPEDCEGNPAPLGLVLLPSSIDSAAVVFLLGVCVQHYLGKRRSHCKGSGKLVHTQHKLSACLTFHLCSKEKLVTFAVTIAASVITQCSS